MTEAEQKLWGLIRYRKINGLKFRRQYSVAGFVVDFYCPELKLALEVDGSIHDSPEQQGKDRERERIIKSVGLSFLRLTNDQVLHHSEKAVRLIKTKVTESVKPGSPFTRGSSKSKSLVQEKPRGSSVSLP